MTRINYLGYEFNVEFEFNAVKLSVIINEWRPVDIKVKLPSRTTYFSPADLDLSLDSRSKNGKMLREKIQKQIFKFVYAGKIGIFVSKIDTYYVFGQPKKFKFEQGEVYLDHELIGFSSTLKNAHKLIKVYLAKKLLQYVTKKQEEICHLMNFDQKSTCEIVEKKSFWGRCYMSKKHVEYNITLIKQKYEFIDSVIYHEVTHLTCKECHGHDYKFYNRLLSYWPRYNIIMKDRLNIFK